MRLIDADAFKAYMRNALEQTRNAYPDKGEWAETITEQFCEDIDDQPTVYPDTDTISRQEKSQEVSNNSPELDKENGELISRKAAIDLFPNDDLEWDTNGGYIAPHMARQMICELPSAQPQRMRAKWIATTSLQEGQIPWKDYKCSNCSHHRGKPMNFCEVCGAKMER